MNASTSPELVRQIARAVLYEGYLLYPYRPSVKNALRWTFGVLLPPGYVAHASGSDRGALRLECLVVGDSSTQARGSLCFLQPVAKRLNSGEPWHGAVEERLDIPSRSLAELIARPWRKTFEIAAESVETAGHDRQPLSIAVRLTTKEVAERVFQLTLEVENLSLLPEADCANREAALARALVSTHVILEVADGCFESLIDPAAELAALAGQCRNEGVWPVLVGAPGQRTTILAAPIILYDYPQIAPQSPGDLFDGTEIDEILSLRVSTLTDEEKQASMALDPRARELVERTERLRPDDYARLHGAMQKSNQLAGPLEVNVWQSLEPTVENAPCVSRGGHALSPGALVRLCPQGSADLFDLALSGRIARIESVEQDFEGKYHLAVTVEDDPGRDLGRERFPAHRFFFRPDEVEWLDPAILPRIPGDNT